MEKLAMHTHQLVLVFVLLAVSHVHAKNTFENEALRITNALRNIHGSKVLRLDDDLKKKATEIAVNASKDGKFSEQEGVNTFMLCTTMGRRTTAKETIEAWYDEICSKGFSFDKPNNKDARAFTQLIWKDTSLVGFGKATQKYGEKGSCTFVAADFRPPGNVEVQSETKKDEQFLENVKKGRFNQSYCDKFPDDNKRQHISQTVKRDIVDEDNHEVNRRSLYYRFPAKFLIDPVTGQTRAIAPEQTTNPFTKSQLAASPEPQPQQLASPYAESPQYGFTSPYVATGGAAVVSQPQVPYVNENSFYNHEQPAMPALQYSAATQNNNNMMTQHDVSIENSGNVNVKPQVVNTVEAAGRQAMVGNKKSDAASKSKMREDALKMHNELRKIHGSPPMELDDKLSEECDKWAQKNADINKMEHSAAKEYGENLAYRCTSDNNPASVKSSVKDWYAEVCGDGKNSKDYVFDGSFQGSALHFTQVVWKKSTKLGIGMATSKSNGMYCTYFVGRYIEKGNFMDQFKENVPEGNFKKSMCDKIKEDDWEPSAEDTAGASDNPADKEAPNQQETSKENAGSQTVTGNGNTDNATATVTTPVPPTEPTKATPQEDKPTKETPQEIKPAQETPKEDKPTQKPTTDKPTDGAAPKPVDKNEEKSDENSGKTQQEVQDEIQQQEDEKNYQEDALKVMNKFRALHGASPLTADSALHTKAKQRADAFVTGVVKRTERKQQVGENVQVSCNPIDKVLPPEESMANGYREVCSKNYSFESEGPQNAAHFTQMVWKNSKSVGVAYSTKKKRNGNLCTVIVSVFDPPGNTAGEFTKNVEKGDFDRSFCGSLNTIAESALDDKENPSENKGAPEKGKEAGDQPPSNSPQNKPEEEVQSTKVGESPKNPSNEPKVEDNANNGEPMKTKTPKNNENNDIDDDDEDDDEDAPDSSQKAATTPAPPTPTTKPPQETKPAPAETTTEDKTSKEDKEKDADFNKKVLVAHNALRSIHGSASLKENTELDTKANEVSRDIALSLEGSEKRSGDVDFGENVEQQCFDDDTKKIDAEEAVLQWWSKGFCDGPDEFSTDKITLTPGTQVIWKDSKEIGVGKTDFKNKEGKSCTVVVALYTPKGNVEGEERNNVKAGDFDYNSMCKDKSNTLLVAKEMMEGDDKSKPNNQTQPTDKPGKPSDPTEGDDSTETSEQQKEKQEEKKPSTDEPNADAFAKDALDAHNTLRKIHNAAPMTLDDEMTKSATEYAKKLAEMGTLRHSPSDERNNAGENLAYACSSNMKEYPASDPVGAWYSEICAVKFHQRRFCDSTPHFSQIIWKNSLKLGIGIAKIQKAVVNQTCFYTVSRYLAPGNVEEEYSQNVEKGSFRHYDSRRRRRGRQKLGYCDRKTKMLKVEILNPSGTQQSNDWVTVLGPLLKNEKLQGNTSLKRSRVKPIESILQKGIMKKGITSF